MLFSCEDIRSWRGAVGAGTLRLGLDAARHPCCICYAEGADGTTGRSVAIRSLGLRSLAGDPAGGVKPRRLRWRGVGPWGLRAPTPTRIKLRNEQGRFFGIIRV